MPLTDTIRCPELTQPRPMLSQGPDPSGDAFFSTLFESMERQRVRYCALHAQGGLLYGTDFAVHPGDQGKLSAVLAEVKEAGFLPVQRWELGPGEHRIVFARIIESKPEIVTIDLVLGSRDGVRAERIVQQRKREGKFWVSSGEPAEQGARSETSLCMRMGYWVRKLGNRFSRKGAFLVFLGPDGVGKTTLLRAVSRSLVLVFPEQSIYQWRPAVFARAPRLACLPHSKPMRSTWGSISYLLFTCLDFTSGYVLAIRAALSRSGLVIFDRYYHDLLIDPKRYRYSGPMWLVRALSRLLPPRDAFFVVLDAEEQTILSRKQQLPPDEIRRQRCAYREFAGRAQASVLVNTERPLEQCRAEALEQIFGYLFTGLAKRNPGWFGLAQPGLGATPSASRSPDAAKSSLAVPVAALRPAENFECEATLNEVPPQL